MELKSIEAFLNIVEKGSITMAADSMYISQPAITLRIQKLEKELDTQLFIRNGGKRAILTTEGKKIYPFLKEGFSSILKGTDVLKTNKLGFGQIRLSCPNHMSHNILLLTLKTLYDHFPGIDFNVKMEITSQIVEDIRKGKTDVGLIYLDVEEENEIYTITPLVMEETVLVASPNHHLTQRSPLVIKDLKQEKFIVYAKTANNTIIFDQFLHKYGLKEYKMIEINNLEWIKTMVKNGLGIAFLSKNIVEEELKINGLKELFLCQHPLPTTPISIIFRKEVPMEIQDTITKAVRDLFQK